MLLARIGVGGLRLIPAGVAEAIEFLLQWLPIKPVGGPLNFFLEFELIFDGGPVSTKSSLHGWTRALRRGCGIALGNFQQEFWRPTMWASVSASGIAPGWRFEQREKCVTWLP